MDRQKAIHKSPPYISRGRLKIMKKLMYMIVYVFLKKLVKKN